MSDSDRLRNGYDVIVVGSAAGALAAASLCARSGLSTILFDEPPTSPSGAVAQIQSAPSEYWERISGAGMSRRLAEELKASGGRYEPAAAVWAISDDLTVAIVINGAARILTARKIILAARMLERPFPIPGWTLPGVITTSVALSQLEAALVPAGPVVLAGCGPMLAIAAWRYLSVGAQVVAILDTSQVERDTRANEWKSLRWPFLRWYLDIARTVRQRIPVVPGIVDLRAMGDGAVHEVHYRAASRRETRIKAACLLLHQGFIPEVNLAMSVGIAHHWDDDSRCWVPTLDASLRSSLEGIAIADGGSSVGDAEAAVARGRLAAITTIRALRPDAAIPLGSKEARCRHVLERHWRQQRFMKPFYRSGLRLRLPKGETIVCRCEQVTAQTIIWAARLGCVGLNQAKAFTRCGMGRCQGRMCGVTATELIAEVRGVSPSKVGYFRVRPPITPVTLGEIATLVR